MAVTHRIHTGDTFVQALDRKVDFGRIGARTSPVVILRT
jgi:hypothetical protein